ncbi:hypothetical protein LOTGIDRAFT_154337 [Lottia gigantea]|uniref:WH2 domain-containing protein n=1 Tax=Lottia gigantea TaxID=225164 RepID=V4A2T2_LOTGI|nr:hypothetical protein LOTGIDRAFT_154337 [Lottia gigantea]ESO89245.1 hypothetical protein LOTGIDRAFT_154337 [Lottia gigantea]
MFKFQIKSWMLRPREQTKQKSLKQIPTMKDKWEAQKFGEELSNYQVPDTKKRIDTQKIPDNMTSQLDEASISSSGSTVTNVSTSLGKAETDRSALLNEIRIGTRLKKLNRLEEKEEKKKMPSGRLDVQAIMDKAFEMRRRVIEDSESEEENDSDENEW